MNKAREAALVSCLSELYGLDAADLKADTPLFSSGLLDSFVLVELIEHLEQSERIKIKPAEVRLDNFDSIAKMVALVDRLKPVEV